MRLNMMVDVDFMRKYCSSSFVFFRVVKWEEDGGGCQVIHLLEGE